MILLMVMGTMLVIMVMAARLSDVALDAQRSMNFVLDRESNYQVARSAAEMGFELLRADTGSTDSPTDMWAAGDITLDWEGRQVTISVVDEESKFPLSAMQKQPDSCDFLAAALTRFCTNAGVRNGEELCDQFLDYVDSDAQRRSRGAESGDYSGKIIKDAPMDSLYELLALPAWENRPTYRSPRSKGTLETVAATAQSSLNAQKATNSSPSAPSASPSASYSLNVPKAQQQGGEAVSEWQDWMSLYSSGKIDINTAPKEILLCLDDAMTEVLVNEIDSTRRSTAFSSTEDLRKVTGMDADLLFRIQDFLCVRSEIFTITATVNAHGSLTKCSIVADRSDGKIKVLRWEVH